MKYRKHLLKSAKGNILEIGIGTGTNLAVYWSYVNILDTKSQTFYAALLANNSH